MYKFSLNNSYIIYLHYILIINNYLKTNMNFSKVSAWSMGKSQK